MNVQNKKAGIMNLKYSRTMLFYCCFLICSVLPQPVFAQQAAIDEVAFFTEQSVIDITLVTDFKILLHNKEKDIYQPAFIVMRFNEHDSVSGEIEIRSRGALRKEICYPPPLMLNFKTEKSPLTKPLGTLKLVLGCDRKKNDDQLVLKEYLTYKMYNLLTGMSFRVRLASIEYADINHKMESYTQHAFFIEDVDDMAKRNNCMHIKGKFNTEATNRKQMTLVALFEYMIGNWDYVVSANQNIKLLKSQADSNLIPYVVPYDFDYTGLVNANYAVPHPDYPELTTMTQRKYLGFSRTMEELDSVFVLFNMHHAAIDSLIVHQDGLTSQNQQIMKRYIDEFYTIICNKKWVKELFISGARYD